VWGNKDGNATNGTNQYNVVRGIRDLSIGHGSVVECGGGGVMNYAT